MQKRKKKQRAEAESPGQVTRRSPTRWWLVRPRPATASTANRHLRRCRYARGRARCYNYQLSAFERSNTSAKRAQRVAHVCRLNLPRPAQTREIYFSRRVISSLMRTETVASQVRVSLTEPFLLKATVRNLTAFSKQAGQVSIFYYRRYPRKEMISIK